MASQDFRYVEWGVSPAGPVSYIKVTIICSDKCSDLQTAVFSSQVDHLKLTAINPLGPKCFLIMHHCTQTQQAFQ